MSLYLCFGAFRQFHWGLDGWEGMMEATSQNPVSDEGSYRENALIPGYMLLFVFKHFSLSLQFCFNPKTLIKEG